MKLNCTTEKIKNAISITERVTGKNLTLPILSSILLIASGKSLKIRATNLSIGVEVEIPATIEKEGVAAVSGDILNNLFTNINTNQEINISLENDNLLIQTKNNKIILKNFSPDDFPTIPIVKGESITIPSNKFIDGIKSVYYASAISDIKPEIGSIYIYQENDNLVFVATDSFRLAEKKIKIKNIENFPAILIPFKNIVEILRIFSDINDDIKICFSKNQISFSSKNIYFTSRVIDGIFPDYKQIIPKNHTTEIIILKQDLLNSLKMSNVFSDKFNQITFQIQPKEKLFELKSKNNDIGENTTKLDASLSGVSIVANFNQKYLLDCIQSIKEDSIVLQMVGDNKPLVVSGLSNQSFMYLIMPMNR